MISALFAVTFTAGPGTAEQTKVGQVVATLDRIEKEIADGIRTKPASDLRDLANRLFDMGEYSQSSRACSLLASTGPLEGRDGLTCARPLLARGAITKARSLLDEFVAGAANSETRVQAVIDVAEALEQVARYSDAADYLARGTVDHPDDMELALRHVHNLLRSGDLGRAGEAARLAASRISEGRNEFLKQVCLLLAGFQAPSEALSLARSLTEAPSFDNHDLDAVVTVSQALHEEDLIDLAVGRFLDLSSISADSKAGARRAAVRLLERHGLVEMAAGQLRSGIDAGELTQPDDLFDLGRLEVVQQRFEEAESAFGRFLAVPVENLSEATIRVAEVWLDANRPSLAVRILRKNRSGWDRDRALALGRALHALGDDVGEWTSYEESAALLDDTTDFWLLVGGELSSRDNPDYAVEAYRYALDGTGGDSREMALAHVGLAENLVRLEEIRDEDVEKELLAALGSAASDPQLLDRVERTSDRIAPSGALTIALLKAAVAAAPQESGLWAMLADAYLNAGQPSFAFEAFTLGIAVSEDQAAALDQGARSLLQGGYRNKAFRLVRSSEEQGIDATPSLMELLGRTCLQLRDVPCSQRRVGAFLETPVQMTYDYRTLGEALTRARLWQLAEKAFQYAVRATPLEGHWEIDLSKGRLELLRGRKGRADERFVNAYENSPQKRKTLVRIAGDYELNGHLEAASVWYARALDDPEPGFKARIMPVLINLLWKHGRTDEVEGTLSRAGGMAFSSISSLRNVAVQLATVGLLGRAVDLVRDVQETLPERELAVSRDLLDALMLKMGMVEPVFSRAEKYCSETGSEETDGACLVAARRLSARLRPDLSNRLLEARSAREDASSDLMIERASLLWLLGDFEKSIAEASRAAGLVESASSLTSRLGPILLREGSAPQYLLLLQKMKGRKSLDADPILLHELGRAHLAVGNRKEGIRYLRDFVKGTKSGIATVYRELAISGMRKAAVQFVRRSRPAHLSTIQPVDLRDICLDLLRTGYRDVAMDLLVAFRKGYEGGEAADEILGRVYYEMGWHPESIRSFSYVDVSRLTVEGTKAYLKALLASGLAGEALETAGRVLDHLETRGNDDSSKNSLMEVVRLFLSEGENQSLLTLLGSGNRRDRLTVPMRLRLATIMAETAEPSRLDEVRAWFLDTLEGLDRLPEEGVEYIRFEIRRGGALELRDSIRERGNQPVFLEAAWTVNCLAGSDGPDTGTGSAHQDSLHPDVMNARTRALFRCGRWNPAFESAMESLGVSQPLADREALVETAAVSANMLGGDHRLRNLEAAIRDVSVDRTVRSHLEGVSSLVIGDYPKLAQLFLALSDENQMDSRRHLAAVEGALWDGSEDILEDSRKLALELAEDKRDAALNLARLFRRTIRDDLADTVLADVVHAFPHDRSISWFQLESALRHGDDSKALERARAHHRRFGSPADIADIVVLAAQQASAAVVEEFQPLLVPSRSSSEQSAAALYQAGLFYLRMGREEDGYKAVKQAYDTTRDSREFLSQLAYASLVEPDVPVSLLRSLIAHHRDVVETARRLPLVVAARCLDGAGSGTEAARCARSIVNEQRYLGASILLGAARKAILTERHEVGLALLKEAILSDRTVVVRHRVLDIIVTLVWPGTDLSGAMRQEFARLGFEALGNPVEAGTSLMLAPYLTHTEDLSGDLDAGIGVYQDLIGLAPSHAGLRNNLAYVLSIRGIDQARAVREARIARSLSSRSSSFYMETEAWAEYLRNRPERALELQTGARRLWSLGQGGGLSESFYHLGRIQETQGRNDEAAGSYRRAFLLEPLERFGRDALKRWRGMTSRD